MIEFLSFLLLFSLPILLILIVNLKQKQRLVYSHALLGRFRDQSLRDFLFRFFQLYGDILADLLLAVVLALLLSGLLNPPTRDAVCLDGSYSMTLGTEGDTPLERALRLISRSREGRDRQVGEGDLPGGRLPERFDLFLLTFNTKRLRSELVSLRKEQILADPGRAKEELLADYHFFNPDLGKLERLFSKRYRRIIFITDRFPAPDTNLELVELGAPGRDRFFYPLSASYDFQQGGFALSFYRQGAAGEISVQRFNMKDQRFADLEDRQVRMAESVSEKVPENASYFTLRIRQEGLFRVAGEGLEYGFRLQRPIHPMAVSGPYSRILERVLPQLEEGLEGGVLADLEYHTPPSPRGFRKMIRALGKGRPKILTFLPPPDQGAPRRAEQAWPFFIHPLDRSLARPSLTAFPLPLFKLRLDSPGSAILFQHPRRIVDGQTPMVYASLLEESLEPPFLTLPPRRARLVLPGSTFLLIQQGKDLWPLNLAPEELFTFPHPAPLVFPSKKLNRPAWFFLLLLLYGAKLGFLLLFHRRQRQA